METLDPGMRAVLAAHPEPAFISVRRVLRYVNPAGERLLGYPSGQLEGRDAWCIVDPGDHAMARSRLRALLRTGLPEPPHELRLLRADGAPVQVEVVAAVVDLGAARGVVTFARDVGERKQVQARRAQADRLISVGSLAGGVAHEINNPLTYVVTNLGFAKSEVRALAASLGEERVRDVLEALAEAEEGAERVRAIVRSLRAFSRAETDAHGPVDVRASVRTVLDVARPQARGRARLVEELEPVPLVDANEGRLSQVFLNLLRNAVQAIPEGGPEDAHEVRIRTAVDVLGRVVIEVSDTGCGIPPALVPRVFDPFFTTRPPGQGVGLGLAIAQGVVAELGGSLEVESEPGMGSVFRVALPPSAVEREEDTTDPVTAPPVPRARVLVVDDEPNIGAVVVRALRDEHDVESCTSGAEVLRRLDAGERFDLLLCDMMMAGMTGMELHARLRRVAPELRGARCS